MNEINTDIKFVDFRLIRLNFALNENFHSKVPHAEVQTEFKIHHEISGKKLKVFLALRFNDDAVNSTPFILDIECSALFSLHHLPSPTKLKSLVNQHCAVAMFPYLRETIADLTRRAGFPPLHIPLIDFTQAFTQTDTGPTSSPSVH